MKRFLALLFLSLFAAVASAQQINLSTSEKRSKKQRIAPFKLPKIKQYDQYAAYWTVEPGWRTEIQLRNNVSNSGNVPEQYQTLKVTPYVRLANGEEIRLDDVEVKAADVTTFDLETAMRAKLPVLPGVRHGSLRFSYTALGFKNLYAVSMVHYHGYPIAFHIDGSGIAEKLQLGSREGIWWLPNATAQSYVVISNYSQKNTTSELVMRDARGKSFRKPVSLAGGETVRIPLRQLRDSLEIKDEFGSFSIESGTNAGGIDSVAFVYDEIAKFSAYLKMFDRNPTSKREDRAWNGVDTWTLRAPMLALTQPDPALAFPQETKLQPSVTLSNSSAAPLEYDATFYWTGKDGKQSSFSAGTKSISSKETQLIDVGALQKSGNIPMEANWATVAISSKCKPGDLIAIASSYDETLRYGAQNPFSDVLSYHMEGSRWEVADTLNSLSTIGNGTQEPVPFALTIFYGGGRSMYEVNGQLGPFERVLVDFGKLIRNRIPDKNGKLLPADLTWGSYQIRETDRKGFGALFEGKVIIDKTFGSVTYGCFMCDGYAGGGQFEVDPVGLGVSDQLTASLTATSGLTGATEYVTNYYDTWWTDNSSIASSPSFATWQGNGAGTTTGNAFGVLPFTDGAGVHRPEDCPTFPDQPIGTLGVKPTITGPNTVWWFGGQQPSGYATSITLTSSGGNGTIWSVIQGAEKITLTSNGNNATITSNGSSNSSGYSSTVGDIKVTAQINFQTSAPFSITSRTPMSLTFAGLVKQCDAGFGYMTFITYDIRDNLNSALPLVVPFTEKWTTQVFADTANNWGRPSEVGATGFQVIDQISGVGVNNNPPPNPFPVCVGTTQVQHWGQEWRIGSESPGFGKKVQDNTFVRFSGQALHTDIVSPPTTP